MRVELERPADEPRVRRRGRRGARRPRSVARSARRRRRRSRRRGAGRAGSLPPRHRGARRQRGGGGHPARARRPRHEGGGDRPRSGVRGRAARAPRRGRGARRGGVRRRRSCTSRSGPGCSAQPLGGYEHADVPAWLPDRHHRGRAPRRAQQHRRGGRARRGADDPWRALRPRVVPSVRASTSSPTCSRGSAAGDRLAAASSSASPHCTASTCSPTSRAACSPRSRRPPPRCARSPETVLIEEGAVEAHLFAVVEGRVRVHRGDQTLVELGPGTTVGELAVLVPAAARGVGDRARADARPARRQGGARRPSRRLARAHAKA